jgi:ligand-binding SRPBCC domain-containing protein
MRLHLQFPVAQPYQAVIQGFTVDLFQALSPPFPQLKILRFDGSFPGDHVEIELRAGPITRRWTSLITEREEKEGEAWFVDEGQELPAPLKFWRHKHLITQNGGHSVIQELIEYRTGSKLLDALLYPIFYAQFAARGPVYRRFFGEVKA